MIYKVPENFIFTNLNPITNRAYDNSWIAYSLTTSDKYEMMNGGREASVYILRVSKNYPYWKMSLMDFINFYDSNKNIILSISDDDLESAENYYLGHHYNEKELRSYEPEVLIHSTTTANWESIQEDSCLKSWNILKSENKHTESTPIGKQLGDPKDFSDYIMFSGGATSSEIVVLSKQHNKIIMNQDMKYKTGIRLYFDSKKIARDGLLIRDGCHLKVKDKLPMEPYLLWVADWKSVGLRNQISTPAEFTAKANNMFNELYGSIMKTTF